MDGAVNIFTDNLHEHINGAAPFYYEMGFDSLYVAKYEKFGSELEFNAYRMHSAEAALAIYLSQSGNENPSELFECRNSVNPYQLHLVKGKLYVQVNIYLGKQKTLNEIRNILQPVLAREHTEYVALMDRLPQLGLVPGSERIASGNYSLRSIYNFGDYDPLELNASTFAVAGKYKNTRNITTKIFVSYPDSASAANVFSGFVTKENQYIQIIEYFNNYIVFQDIRKQYGIIQLDSTKIFIETRLEKRPH